MRYLIRFEDYTKQEIWLLLRGDTKAILVLRGVWADQVSGFDPSKAVKTPQKTEEKTFRF